MGPVCDSRAACIASGCPHIVGGDSMPLSNVSMDGLLGTRLHVAMVADNRCGRGQWRCEGASQRHRGLTPGGRRLEGSHPPDYCSCRTWSVHQSRRRHGHGHSSGHHASATHTISKVRHEPHHARSHRGLLSATRKTSSPRPSSGCLVPPRPSHRCTCRRCMGRAANRGVSHTLVAWPARKAVGGYVHSP